MGPSLISGLYAIIDSGYVSLEKAGECAEELAAGGARLVQLRAKDASGSAALKAAQDIRKALSGKAVFIVNDRADIALLCGAEGVHLGQDDIPLKEVRRLMPSSIIGVSTHNLEEAKRAEGEGADYISFGPIFPTITKKDADAPKGIKRLQEIASKIDLPVVAIGGIAIGNVRQVMAAGASSAAVISDILLAADIRAKVSEISALMNRG